MRIKRNLLVLFGGMSKEHDVSQMSVKNVIRNINREDYNIYIVGITKMGRWIYVKDISDIENKSWIYGDRNAYLLPDRERHSLMIVEDDLENAVQQISIDVCFPVLHGKNGEDGAIQGLLELSGIPYVGSDILSSAVCLDKSITKMIVEKLGIRQAKSITIDTRREYNIENINKDIEKEFKYPVYVKPSNSGSSVGISKVDSFSDLDKAINIASNECYKVIIEEAIIGRELECAVLSDDITRPLAIGEIIAGGEFYSYDAKYNSTESKTIIDPELPDGVEEKIFKLATMIFDELRCYSLARVDFFLEDGTNDLVFNEINTIPGFTDISMYPMLAQKSGMSNRELINALLESALKRN